MLGVVHWIGFAIGLVTVIATWQSIINTIILPRLTTSSITYVTWKAVHKLFLFAADQQPRYESKDRLLALLGPVALLAGLVSWMFLLLIGFALMFWPLIAGDFGTALRIAGSSFFTLGVFSSPAGSPVMLEFIAAASGMIVVALQIGYLPTIYSAYNRRETLITALSARAGKPAWGPEILARHQLSHAAATLPALFASWETWAADITESHVSYPWLTVFRSPDPLQSWVVSQLAILDAAALYVSLSPDHAPPEAYQCLRVGFDGLRTIAKVSGTTINEDPRPDDPLVLTYEGFVRGVEHIRESGFPIERTPEEAWPHFRGWRVNYEEAAHFLANYVIAVPAPWSGKRRNMTKQQAYDIFANRPRHRTPNDPEGLRVRRIGKPPLESEEQAVAQKM